MLADISKNTAVNIENVTVYEVGRVGSEEYRRACQIFGSAPTLGGSFCYNKAVSLPSSLIIEQILIILPCPFLIIEGMTALDTINGALRSMSALFKKDFAVKILAAADN